MSRLRVLFGCLLVASLVSLVMLAAPGAEGLAVPGERILYVDLSASVGVHLMDPDGTNDSVIFEDVGSPLPYRQGRWVVSPDGRWVVYQSRSGSSLWVASVDGGTDPVAVFEAVEDPFEDQRVLDPAWSPDSRRLVFHVETTSNREVHEPSYRDLWMVNRDGTELVNLTDTPVESESSPVWFPDGKQILFVYSPSPWATIDLEELAVLDLDAGGSYEVITDEPDLYFSTYEAGFINDGRQVILQGSEILETDPLNPQWGPGDLWRMDVATGNMNLMLGANTDNWLTLMDMSADASMMLYRASADDRSVVWLADANGGNRTRVYNEPGMHVWSAQFNADDTVVLLNPHDETTDYIVVMDMATADVTMLRSGELLRHATWVAPGVLCDGRMATMVGTDGADTLVGTSGEDVIVGFGGDDVIEGRSGNDVVCAGYGNDVVHGGAGDDMVFGGPGQDELRGGAGKDTVWGESGNDTLYGGKGKDVVRGGGGADWIHGQWKRDRLYGDLGKDIIYGGDGDDTLAGGKADDHLYGGDGDDDAAGNLGNDMLYGGPGDDVLTGGPDIDVVNGNTGTDTCTGETTSNC